jgi:hypothetical protein
MPKNTHHETTRDHEDEDDHDDDTGILDWPELASLYMDMYEDDVEAPDYSLLGSYARDSRCERHETRHRRY